MTDQHPPPPVTTAGHAAGNNAPAEAPLAVDRVDLQATLPHNAVHGGTDKPSVRRVIVLWLFWIFAGTIGIAAVAALLPCQDHEIAPGQTVCPRWEQTKALMDLLLPAETALLGAAIAFYMTEAGEDHP